jgi:hypothetical protein
MMKNAFSPSSQAQFNPALLVNAKPETPKEYVLSTLSHTLI